MTVPVKFHAYVEHLHEGVHNFASDATCTLTVALCNAANAPDAAADAVLADIVPIAYTNMSARVLSIASSGQSSGLYKLVVNDLTLTSSVGDVAPFRYVVIYNDDPTSPADPLICYLDYGAEITLHGAAGDTFVIDMSAVNGLLQAT